MQETEDIVTRLEKAAHYMPIYPTGPYDTVNEAATTIATLRAEVEGLRADAERYRWLRQYGNPSNDPINQQRGLTLAVDGAVKLHMVFWCTRKQLDAAIDAAKADKEGA